MAPPSQKFRQISFTLDTGVGLPAHFAFSIRPEELTRQEPSRGAVNQTLGGAWIDSWGPGVSSISLSGTCGWRGSLLLSGEDLFAALRDTTFAGYHQAREQAIARGTDPDAVTLTLTDSLDGITVLVYPKRFTLRRSKASPLLMRYSLDLDVLGDATSALGILDQITQAMNNPLRWLAGVTGLGSIISTVQYYATTAENVVGSAGAAVGNFLSLGTTLLGAVATVAQAGKGTFDTLSGSLLSTAATTVQAGSNAMAVFACDQTLPVSDRLVLSKLASTLNGAACTMSNAFNSARGYTSFDALFGASTCSSTGGGREASAFTLEFANPFALLVPAASAPVVVTPTAQAALAALCADPLLLVGQQAQVAALLAVVTAGVTVSAT